MAHYSIDLTKWSLDSHCDCDGTLGLIYKYKTNPDITLKIQPALYRFSLYDSHTGVWHQPLRTLDDTLTQNKL
jgi:hypothetical protein